MDEYLDPFLTSSSWSDVNTEERSFWSCHETDHLNGLLPNSVGSYESDKEISTVSMIDSCHTVESLASQESSSVIPGGDSDFGLDNSLLLGEAQPPQDGHHHEGESFLNGAVNSSSIISYMGLQSDTAKSALSSLNLGSVKELPVGNMNRSPLPFCESDKVRCYGSELSEFQRTCRDFQSLPPIPQLWTPSSFEGAASLSPLGKDNMHGFGIQGAYAASEIYAMGNRYVRDDKTMQLDNLSVAVPMKGKEEWQNHPASSFVHQPQRTMTTAGLQSPSQIASALPSGNCNGAGKPRVRARRGQATDPHSIAERLRREKIAEGMKQLQELVPDNNKTDKASMLDEIIEYVKFLQLQVKVLSMSRLGAAEAVVPLITNSQTEGSNGLLPSPSADQVIDSFQSSEQSTLEREVVKLMESNVTMAMQYLQRKGLCLMPIALATAISSGKRSSSGLVSVERKNFDWSDSALSYSSCSNLTGIGNHQMCPDDCDLIGRLGNGGIRVDGCNGTVLKVEDMNNSTQTVQEVKPNT